MSVISFLRQYNIAVLKISTDVTCESGTVHLVGGDAISRGRVEYCYDGSWYSVCASDLDQEGARVVCNTLGYDTDNYSKYLVQLFKLYNSKIICTIQSLFYLTLVVVQAAFYQKPFSVSVRTVYLVTVLQQIKILVSVSM